MQWLFCFVFHLRISDANFVGKRKIKLVASWEPIFRFPPPFSCQEKGGGWSLKCSWWLVEKICSQIVVKLYKYVQRSPLVRNLFRVSWPARFALTCSRLPWQPRNVYTGIVWNVKDMIRFKLNWKLIFM